MKRKNNLYQVICSMDNLRLADTKARRGKKNQPSVKEFDAQAETKLLLLHEMLINKTYKTSPYETFTVREPKERLVYRLPYWPDRITHHAIMNPLESIFASMFISTTYSCIKRKGINAGVRDIEKAMKDVPGTKYCLKMDIRKFYPNIDHHILKALLRRKFKDKDLLWLLDGIIDSAPGLPIGNYLSQYLANFYLSYLDHHLKEVLKVGKYFRYLDDMVIFSHDKEYLHWLRAYIQEYLRNQLKIELKSNYQVFLVESRGVNVLGYVFWHGYIQLRPTIKKKFARKMSKRRINPATRSAYMGWAAHCNSKHLIKKLCKQQKLKSLKTLVLNQKQGVSSERKS